MKTTKLVRESLYEFHQSGDPLKSLNIGFNKVIIDAAMQGNDSRNLTKGMNKDQIEKLISELRGSIPYDLIEEFLYDVNYCIETFFNKEKAEHFFWLMMLLGDKNIKIIDINSGDDVPLYLQDADLDQRFVYLEQNHVVNKYLKKGWELFHKEDIRDVIEYFLVRYELLPSPIKHVRG